MKKIFLLAGLVCAAAAAHAEGWTEGATKYEYSGWACDPSTPGYQGWVHIYRESTYIGALPANQPREAAVGQLCGNDHGAHGYNGVISFPQEILDNQWHKVRFYFLKQDGSGAIELNGSPRDVKFDGATTPPPMPVTPQVVSECGLQQPGPGWVNTAIKNDQACILTKNAFRFAWTNTANLPSGYVLNSCLATGLPNGWYITQNVTPRAGEVSPCENRNWDNSTVYNGYVKITH
ncbi:hypothetical protein ACFX58_00100 [Sphingomonas sp. NCPPB 2930]